MVRAWIADVTPLYEDGCYREYYGSIPDFRKKKADALRTVEMKAQSVGAWTLWEQIRSMYGLPVQEQLHRIVTAELLGAHRYSFLICSHHAATRRSVLSGALSSTASPTNFPPRQYANTIL